MTDKEIIFEKYCELYSIDESPYSCPSLFRINSWLVAKDFENKPSLYRVRKAVKELVSEGLLKKDIVGGQFEDGVAYCIRGYCLTEKATETDVYKRISVDIEKAFDKMYCEDKERTDIFGW